MGKARAWAETYASEFRAYENGRLPWPRLDHACLLHGPPGTGKTTFAAALAATCKLPLIATGFGQWQSSGHGDLGSLLMAMDEAFADARRAAPCVFFIDELDSIPKRGAGSRDKYYNSVVNHLLTRLDDLKNMKGVVVLAACNHPDLLDEALTRSGRMDTSIQIELPSLEDIPKIILFHLKLRQTPELLQQFSQVAVLCQGMSGADIERLVRHAQRLQSRDNRKYFRTTDLVNAIQQNSPQLDPNTLYRCTVHEAGHAIAALRCGFDQNVSMTLNTKNGLGETTFQRPAHLMTRKDAEGLMTVFMAGRAAEQVELRSVSSSSGGNRKSDLAEATCLAIDCITRLGLSENGLMPWTEPTHKYNLSYYPPEVRQEVDRMLSQAYQRAISLMNNNHRLLVALACELQTQKALSHDQIIKYGPNYRNPRRDFPRRRPH